MATDYDEVTFDALIAQFGDYEAWEVQHDAADMVQASTLVHQTGFLANYSQVRTIAKAATEAGVHRATVHRWVAGDVLGFQARFQAAKTNFVDHLESIAFHRIRHPEGRIGSDILLIAIDLPTFFAEVKPAVSSVILVTVPGTLEKFERIGKYEGRHMELAPMGAYLFVWMWAANCRRKGRRRSAPP